MLPGLPLKKSGQFKGKITRDDLEISQREGGGGGVVREGGREGGRERGREGERGRERGRE